MSSTFRQKWITFLDPKYTIQWLGKTIEDFKFEISIKNSFCPNELYRHLQLKLWHHMVLQHSVYISHVTKTRIHIQHLQNLIEYTWKRVLQKNNMLCSCADRALWKHQVMSAHSLCHRFRTPLWHCFIYADRENMNFVALFMWIGPGTTAILTTKQKN